MMQLKHLEMPQQQGLADRRQYHFYLLDVNNRKRLPVASVLKDLAKEDELLCQRN